MTIGMWALRVIEFGVFRGVGDILRSGKGIGEILVLAQGNCDFS